MKAEVYVEWEVYPVKYIVRPRDGKEYGFCVRTGCEVKVCNEYTNDNQDGWEIDINLGFKQKKNV